METGWYVQSNVRDQRVGFDSACRGCTATGRPKPGAQRQAPDSSGASVDRLRSKDAAASRVFSPTTASCSRMGDQPVRGRAAIRQHYT